MSKIAKKAEREVESFIASLRRELYSALGTSHAAQQKLQDEEPDATKKAFFKGTVVGYMGAMIEVGKVFDEL
jgi:hypothetical protein